MFEYEDYIGELFSVNNLLIARDTKDINGNISYVYNKIASTWELDRWNITCDVDGNVPGTLGIHDTSSYDRTRHGNLGVYLGLKRLTIPASSWLFKQTRKQRKQNRQQRIPLHLFNFQGQQVLFKLNDLLDLLTSEYMESLTKPLNINREDTV
ncbi:MAG: hypothetical protein ACW98D_18540 [Promethearchaeota archaeon]|jgi:hypothetical protein